MKRVGYKHVVLQRSYRDTIKLRVEERVAFQLVVADDLVHQNLATPLDPAPSETHTHLCAAYTFGPIAITINPCTALTAEIGPFSS